VNSLPQGGQRDLGPFRQSTHGTIDMCFTKLNLDDLSQNVLRLAEVSLLHSRCLWQKLRH